MSFWTEGLNPEQVEAVTHNHGPLLILAGAGSGKTTVLVSRTGRLVDEKIVAAKNICVLTFTNKAARELKHRVQKKLGKLSKGLWAGTFHSFGLQVLRTHYQKAGLIDHFGIIDSSDTQGVVKEILKNISIYSKSNFDSEKIINVMNQARVLGCDPLDLKEAQDEYHEIAHMVMPHFLKRLQLMGVVDFEGLLLKPLELFKNHPDVLTEYQEYFSQVMVDEFQDTNMLQMSLIDQLVKKHNNICVVGDDDQSIYGWRGAEIQNILDFPKTHKGCKLIKLEKNYRSTSHILDLANSVIQNNQKRHGKVLKSSKKSTALKELPEIFSQENEDNESEFIAREIDSYMKQGFTEKDMAVLYRSNSQGAFLEAILRKYNISYKVSGGTAFFDRKEIKDILAYMKLSYHPHDLSLRRVINTPPRGIGDTTIEKINDISANEKISFFKACDAYFDGKPVKPKFAASQLDFSTSASHLKVAEEPNDKSFLSEYENMGAKQDRTAADAYQTLNQQLADLRTMFNGRDNSDLSGKLLRWLENMGYKSHMFKLSNDLEAGQKKWTLIEIFARVTESYFTRPSFSAPIGEAASGGVFSGDRDEKSLRNFVDSMELRDEVLDNNDEKSSVQLMTLHASKGLEFPIVFISGIEEEIIPHKNLGLNIDEERRLFYVGVTRAQKKLIMTYCRTRKKYGAYKPVSPSRFLIEIPDGLAHRHESDRPLNQEQRENLVTDFLSQLNRKIDQK